MKIIKNIYNILCISILILLILYINIGTILIIRNTINYLQFSKYLSYFGLLSIIFYILYKIMKKEKLKTKDYIIILLSIFAYLSYYFAFNKNIALNGAYGRNEGLFIIVTYYSIFLFASTIPNKYQKIILFSFLATGILQMLLGTIQTLKITNIFGYSRMYNWSTNFKFASGTLGNPNFYSTYILLCLMYVYGIFIKEHKLINKLCYLLLTILFTYALIIGNTTSCIITFIFVFVITLITKINKKNIKSILISILIIVPITISITLLVDCYANHRITYTMKKNFIEIQEIFHNGITEKTGNYRIYIWKETLKKVPNYFTTGIGIDNFSFIDDGKYLCVGKEENHQCFDKVHNEYLQKLITEGFFSYTLYLTLICYVSYISIKNNTSNKKHYFGLFLTFVSYLMQAFFNISVITVAPIFYMIMGFLCNVDEDNIYEK